MPPSQIHRVVTVSVLWGIPMTWLTVLFSVVGYWTSEGRESHMGETPVLGSHEGSVWRPTFPLLVQSFLWAQLQEDARGAGPACTTRGHHRGGRDWDSLRALRRARLMTSRHTPTVPSLSPHRRLSLDQCSIYITKSTSNAVLSKQRIYWRKWSLMLTFDSLCIE